MMHRALKYSRYQIRIEFGSWRPPLKLVGAAPFRSASQGVTVMEREYDVIELGAVSVETKGLGGPTGDVGIGEQPAGLSDE